jgi:hypothetical protein
MGRWLPVRYVSIIHNTTKCDIEENNNSGYWSLASCFAKIALGMTRMMDDGMMEHLRILKNIRQNCFGDEKAPSLVAES